MIMTAALPTTVESEPRFFLGKENNAPLRIYLVRHGTTAWSLDKRHTGKSNIALTPDGEEQALGLAPVLNLIAFSHVLTSPALRARRTCELAGFGERSQIVQELAEWDYGEYEGKRSVEIREHRPDWNVYRDGCPGGETVRDVTKRADQVIALLRGLSGNVLVFSHGQFGCSLAVRWIGLAVAQAQHFQLAPAAISELAYNPDHPELSVLAQWNSAPAMLPHRGLSSGKQMNA